MHSLSLQSSDSSIAVNDILGRIGFAASNETGSDAVKVSASILAVAEGAFDATSNPTSLTFSTGSSETATEKMRINSDGYVGIGTGTPSEKLHVSGGDILVSGARPVTISAASNIATSKKASAGGWEFSHDAIGSSDTNSGGYGWYGTDDVLSRYWIGPAYDTASFNILYSNGNVGINVLNPVAPLHVKHDNNGAGIRVEDTTTGTAIEIGESAYTASNLYTGITHSEYTGSQEYMLLSAGSHTFVSAKTDYYTYIRGGGNSTTYQAIVQTNRFAIGANADLLIVDSEGLKAKKNIYIDRYLESNIAVGWYTVAVNVSNRACGRFGLACESSGRHQGIIFYASHYFGAGNQISILHNEKYSSSNPIAKIRIKEGGTYDGCLLQVYIDATNSNTPEIFLLGDNINDSGWVVVDWVPDGTDPVDSNNNSLVANFSSLTNVAVEVDLDTVEFGTTGNSEFQGTVICDSSVTASSLIKSGGTSSQFLKADGSVDTSTYLTSVAFSDIAAAAIVTEAEGISSNDNDTTIPTSAAVKDYVDNNGGGISNLVEDTTPQLGGNLDLNSKNISGTGNIGCVGILSSTSATIGVLSGYGLDITRSGSGFGNTTFSDLFGNITFSGQTAYLEMSNTALGGQGIVTMNPTGANQDFRVEGDSDTNLIYADASTDRVGIGTDTPAYLLDVDGDLSCNNLIVNGTTISPDGTTVLVETVNGRLTLETGVAVSTADQTAKTTLYFTPYKGNQIALYSGSDWGIHDLTERSLSLSGYTADTNFDIFIYDNSGTLTLESVAWTNDTTRATALTTQDGVYVKSGATTRRYLGTIRTTATTGQCEDSLSRRFVWSYYNQVKKPQRTSHANTFHTYASQVWRATNNDTTVGVKRYLMVLGLATFVSVSVNNHSKFMYTGAGLDGTTDSVRLGGLSGHNGDPTYNGQTFSFVEQYIAQGYHFIQELEYGVNSSSVGYNSEVAGDHLC